MKVIFYGAGSCLARNLRRLRIDGLDPVCVSDADERKWHKPFFGHPELAVLPLDEALTKFPDCAIHVTVDNDAMGAVLHYLTAERGIPEGRMANWSPIEYRLGCSALETTVKFRSRRVFVRCYWRRPGIARSGDTAEDIRRFGEWRDRTIQDIRDGKPTPCDGCENLKEGWHLVDRKLTSLQISESDTYSFCNFDCCYCFNKARNRPPDLAKLPDADEQLEVLRHVSENMRGRNLELQFSTGEIAVHPNRDKIIELLSGYETLLFTNASIYDERIARLMARGLLTLLVSMDCGTAETFHRVKAVDRYDEVCANLVRYAATGGCVILKYILLEGMNDNETDADGFIDLAEKLGAVVQLSNDTRTRRAKLPAVVLNIVRRIARRAREKNLLLIHERDVFSGSDNDAIHETIHGGVPVSMIPKTPVYHLHPSGDVISPSAT
ncbi:MAG: radical SAM protein [Candidatus Accumulibacter sp.]|jgi:molybdenum cofactor biosynthesis enzyme MoaA|nr:radical SAM protein [Accumulibacter sp.]